MDACASDGSTDSSVIYGRGDPSPSGAVNWAGSLDWVACSCGCIYVDSGVPARCNCSGFVSVDVSNVAAVGSLIPWVIGLFDDSVDVSALSIWCNVECDVVVEAST